MPAIVNAGLPNIYGYVDNNIGNYYFANYGALMAQPCDGNGYLVNNDRDSTGNRLIVDASKSNPLYGSSTTVQPPSIVLIPQLRY